MSASTRSSPRSNQTKLACEAAGSMPELAQLVLELHPLGEVALDAPRHLVLVLESLERGRLRGRVAEERLAHLVDRHPEALRAAQRVADPQPAQPVDLAERPQQHEVRVLVEQRHRLVGVLQHVELDVGLVEDHRDVARDAADEVRDLVDRQRRRGRVVRVADDHEPGRARDLLGHLVQLVACATRPAAPRSRARRTPPTGADRRRTTATRRRARRPARAARRRPRAGCRTSRCRSRSAARARRGGRTARAAARRWSGPGSG